MGHAVDLTIPIGDALAIRRLLWDVGARNDTPHAQKVECLHWAAVLEVAAGMPPWPTPGEPTDEVIRFHEAIAAHVEAQISGLRSSASSRPYVPAWRGSA